MPKRSMLAPDYDQSIGTIADLKRVLQVMGDAVEFAVASSCIAFLKGDSALAQAVIENDRVVNSLEIDIEKGVVRRFAMDHPEDFDLRMLLSIQKITTSLERIGDHAVNIAEASMAFWVTAEHMGTLDIVKMGDAVRAMLADALTSFYDGSAEIASEVLVQDDLVDTMNRTIRSEVKSLVMKNQEAFESGMELVRVSQNLERIADLATNIAEETIFSVKDRIVKHHVEEVLSHTTAA